MSKRNYSFLLLVVLSLLVLTACQTPQGEAVVENNALAYSDSGGVLTVTCQELECTFETLDGPVSLGQGEAVVIDYSGDPPEADADEEDLKRWLKKHPGAAQLAEAVETEEDIVTTEPPPTPTATQEPEKAPVLEKPAAVTEEPEPTPEPTPTQYVPNPQPVGPEMENFPAGVNPLTGQSACSPEALNLPPVLISVSNFPVSARPQAGLSFAPFVYELFIGEGMTRFLTVFYGNFPEFNVPVNGSHEPRTEGFELSGTLLGNQIWLDDNQDGLQDCNEFGVGGVMVNLFSAEEELLASIVTDSNGYYGFNVEPEVGYYVQVELPEGMLFSPMNVGENDAADSDADPDTGFTNLITVSNHDISWDAGMYVEESLLPEDPIEEQEDTVSLGDRVWFDTNMNGKQDEEPGLAGVTVNLYHWEEGVFVASTITDVNGYYRFDGVPVGQHYRIDFVPPLGLSFTAQDNYGADGDAYDSDADIQGKTITFKLDDDAETSMDWDAGLITGYKGGGVGPVRSGRLPYKYVTNFFFGSCLAYAGKWEGLDIPSCATVFNKPEGSTDINNNYMPIDSMKGLAEGNANPDVPLNYTGNVFDPTPPEGGFLADLLTMFYNYNTQTQWEYDPLSGTYLRFTDMADGTGEFYPALDRMTGRQLGFNNVVILFADHQVMNSAGTIIDIGLEGVRRKALVFRDGMMYKVWWNTLNGEYEQETGMDRPIRFEYEDGTPFPMAPGNSWVHIVTNGLSYYEEKAAGQWWVRFVSPAIP